MQSATKSLSDRLGHIFIAYVLFLSCFWDLALKLVDNEHKKGIFENLLFEIGLIIRFAYATLSYLITSTFMEQSLLISYFNSTLDYILRNLHIFGN
uniref:Uncharacterized protein n=1 Tax=Wuchereria bancrofti TaxID=6293 RepID=A0A1I8EW72_WUCBA